MLVDSELVSIYFNCRINYEWLAYSGNYYVAIYYLHAVNKSADFVKC